MTRACVRTAPTPFPRTPNQPLPSKLPAILAAIKTAAVVDIGTATLGALSGAGARVES